MKRAPLGLFLLALAARGLVIAVARFDGLYGQDAYAYLEYARQILITPLGSPLPGPFYWPLGYPALAALFMWFTGRVPLGAQIASVVTGAAIAPLVYWIVIEIRNRGTEAEDKQRMALASGLIAALCGQLLQSSIVIMADAPGLFWATLSTYALLRWERQSNERFHSLWLPLATTSLALAVVTRWIFAGLLLPFGLFAIPSILQRAKMERIRRRVVPSPGHSVTGSQSLLVPLALSAIAFGAILLPQLYFSQHSAAPVLSHGWLVNWNLPNAFRVSFDNPDGHFDYRLPPVIFYAEPLFHPLYLLPLLTPFVALGARRLRRSRALLLLGGWIVTLYLYLVGVPYENFRFGLAFFPPIAVLAGLGVFHPRLKRVLFPGFPILLISLSLLASLLFTYRGLSTFLSIKSRELAVLRFLQSQIPSGSTVVTFGLTLTLDHYTDYRVVELFEQTPGTLRPIVCGPPFAYLFVERDNIESQWAGKSPSTNFLWLRDEVGLQEVGRQGTWSLYSIDGENCDP